MTDPRGCSRGCDRLRGSHQVRLGRLPTPVTSAPNALAICTAYEPTPPAAPMIKTSARRAPCALSRSACKAVAAEPVRPRLVRRSGWPACEPDWTPGRRVLGERTLAGAVDLIANLKPVTFWPTATTVPARSKPGTGVFRPTQPGAERPAPRREFRPSDARYRGPRLRPGRGRGLHRQFDPGLASVQRGGWPRGRGRTGAARSPASSPGRRPPAPVRGLHQLSSLSVPSGQLTL